MLVKKLNPEWFPSENRELKVGETVDITDPKQLIVNGDVIGLAEDGVTELSAYELYGVLVASEAQEFEAFLKMKNAKATEASLKKEQAELQSQLESVAAVVAPVETVVEPVVVEPVSAPKKK